MGDPLRLYGLNALVLNAADGIGEAIARTLVRHGAKVLAVGTKNSGVARHYARVKGITAMEATLVDPESTPGLIEKAAKKLGGLDILVNNFPLYPDAPLDQVDKKLEHLLQSRAALTMAACRAASPYLRKSPQGRIINVGLLRSCFSAKGEAAYAYAEQDLGGMTRVLAAEMGEFSITANYIQPGAVMTPESREVFRKDKALRDHCIEGSAARRLGEPVDVAKVALFLASDDAVFVSGTGIAVDGGRTRAG
ncbi:MAG: SDR family oxidoreductase [Gammaproteobacteria bacterium]|nr:SDR family oxidoreductase [Gammaproteobacteria bacterium]MDH3482384.1 SDR family oxidoreductase [Gammaproteobacteria bacterium]